MSARGLARASFVRAVLGRMVDGDAFSPASLGGALRTARAAMATPEAGSPRRRAADRAVPAPNPSFESLVPAVADEVRN